MSAPSLSVPLGKTAENLPRKLFAEIIGTFFLVFAGTGAIVVNDVSGGLITHVGVALTFGLVVTSLIYTIGDISGCHLNPAVTFGFVLAGRFPAARLLAYAASQIGGAILASALLQLLFPIHPHLGGTHPAGSSQQSFILEGVITLFLMFVILNVSHGANETGLMAGVAVGAVIAVVALFAGPICGASMNPARSIAPALLCNKYTDLWIYCTAPVVGAASAVALYRAVRAN